MLKEWCKIRNICNYISQMLNKIISIFDVPHSYPQGTLQNIKNILYGSIHRVIWGSEHNAMTRMHDQSRHGIICVRIQIIHRKTIPPTFFSITNISQYPLNESVKTLNRRPSLKPHFKPPLGSVGISKNCHQKVNFLDFYVRTYFPHPLSNQTSSHRSICSIHARSTLIQINH